MYLAVPLIKPIKDHVLPLENGEGKNDYFAEAHFARRFIIHKGKYYSYSWLQRARLTFDASILSRLTRDNSSPLLPSSYRFGYGLDYLLSGLAS